MIFHSPHWLWLLATLPLVTVVMVLAWRKRETGAKAYFTESNLEALQVGYPKRWRTLKAVLLLFAFALIVCALARPQYGSRTLLLKKRGIDLVIVLDFSKSMLAQDVRPSRIERAKAEILQLVNELGGDRVGMVSFAGDTMDFPMTTDYSALGLFLRDLGPYDLPVGGTAIGRALVAAQRLLEQASPRNKGAEIEQADRMIVLLTDGEDHEGDPLAAAQGLGEAGIKLIVVGIGSRVPEPIPTYAPDGTWTGYLHDSDGKQVTTSLTAENEQKLKQMAEATGGKYLRAGRGSVGVDQIRAEMARMKHAERESRRVVQHEDRYAWLLLPAFLLVWLESLLPESRIPRPRRRQRAKERS